jgi:hypothetical protein
VAFPFDRAAVLLAASPETPSRTRKGTWEVGAGWGACSFGYVPGGVAGKFDRLVPGARACPSLSTLGDARRRSKAGSVFLLVGGSPEH